MIAALVNWASGKAFKDVIPNHNEGCNTAETV